MIRKNSNYTYINYTYLEIFHFKLHVEQKQPHPPTYRCLTQYITIINQLIGFAKYIHVLIKNLLAYRYTKLNITTNQSTNQSINLFINQSMKSTNT